MITDEVTIDDEGRPILVQRASDDADRAQLVHEATMLALARHPGVAEILSSDADGYELVTATGGHPFRAGHDRPERTLPALAAVCEIVADLHSLGLVHGALDDRAITFTAEGRPRLGRFARAGLAGQARDDGTILRPSLDVEALAAMVSAVLEAHPSPSATRHRRRAHGGQPSGLNRLLAAGRTGRWPPARRLAQAIESEVAARYPPSGRPDHRRRALADAPLVGPEAPLSEPAPLARPTNEKERTDQAEPADEDPFATLRPAAVEGRRWSAPRLATVVAAMAGVMAITWGAFGLIAAHSPSPGRATPPTRSETPPPTRSASARPGSAHAAPGSAALVTAGGAVTVGSVRYSIGQPSDQVAIAAWGCTGSPRAVVLRPATGELFAFAGWATAGHDLAARTAGHVAPGSHLSPVRDATGCAGLEGIDPKGRATTIDPDRAS